MVKMKERGIALRASKGFTLIELLVVIAIIGLLAAVVLASLGSARQKGADAAVKSALDGLRAQAELVASNNSNSYDTVCNATQDPTIKAQIANAAASTGGVVGTDTNCYSESTDWAVWARLATQNIVSSTSGTDYWCVDSSGQAKPEDVLPTSATYKCQ